jgi:beta-glucanase (GH16 family)
MIKWSGYDWLQQERWGQIHLEKPHWWYDHSCSFVDDFGQLNLLTKNNPKYFTELGITSSIGTGLVSCTERFSFGEFEIEAKLPYGNNLWPAFWMWSWDSWPPEIDVLEGYSDNNPNYFKFRLRSPFGFWNIQTNVHYTNGVNKMLGGKNHCFGFKDPTKNFIKYSVIWERNSLRFYYGGKLVRKVTDKSILQQLSMTKMNVIINNGVTSEVDLNSPTSSNFIIKYFKYSSI